ncbi:MAG TPA: hypothetical protein VJW96_01115 [Terriglobales bacterium]|jgi:hypothetical protein|nr:hypothetical protein [Terriglobales bacterium]
MTQLKRALPLAFLLVLAATTVWAQARPERTPLEVTISVQDTTTGQPITNGETLHSTDNFQVTVTTNDITCIGNFLITAENSTGEIGSQEVFYTVGPQFGSNSATGSILNAFALNGKNDWKISNACNGAVPHQFSLSRFEFFVNTKD